MEGVHLDLGFCSHVSMGQCGKVGRGNSTSIKKGIGKLLALSKSRLNDLELVDVGEKVADRLVGR